MNAKDFPSQIMPTDQAALLKDLGGLVHQYGYYLAGGTAVALWLGHRRSIDFDWFSPGPTVGPEDIAAQLQAAGHLFAVKSQSLNLIDGHIRGIRVTFVRYAYPTLEPATMWPDYGCGIASLLDLACMKLAAVAQRGSRKDLIDIHALLQHGLSLGALLADYRRKFGVSDMMPVLRGLAYFDDAEKEPMPAMLVSLDWAQLKSALARLTKEAFHNLHRSGTP